MLSKSAAKAFFLVGTALCFAAFGLLTVDSLRQIPERTKESELTPAVAQGKKIWEESNCMGCHTLLGEGAYYAPELTKVYERRGEAFIKAMLRDPSSMYPGERKMQKYDFSNEEIDALVAFLKWIGGIDTNGFPPQPDLGGANAATALGGSPSAVAPPVFGQVCTTCHAVRGQGGQVGPAFDGIAQRRDRAWLSSWLRDPMAIKPDSRMPKLPLTDAEIDAIVQYLSTL